ncbi:MAG: hypothetical protein JNJ54_27555 [Myxococcaceae bacterium]|nr:hypothetical protein [Myxococcaceae bacterium]
MSALIALLLSQVVAPDAKASPVEPAQAWPTVTTWSDGGKDRSVHLDESLVAERDGDEHTATALRAAGAMVSHKKGRVRLWRVERASVVLESEPRLLPVYRDEGSTKLRVPIGGVLVVPKSGVDSQKLRDTLGRGVVVAHGVVRVPCAPAEVFSLSKALASTAGVAWVQPDWWLGATPK